MLALISQMPSSLRAEADNKKVIEAGEGERVRVEECHKIHGDQMTEEDLHTSVTIVACKAT